MFVLTILTVLRSEPLVLVALGIAFLLVSLLVRKKSVDTSDLTSPEAGESD